MAEDAEVTIEANPAAVGLKDLQDLRRSGFNRLSIGVQSFDDALLEFLGRVHNGAQAEEMVRDARKAGFESIGIDLMYGIPGQTREDWLKDLRSAVDLGAEHISCYSLTVEDGTPYGHSVKSGDAPVPDESLVAELYRATDELLSRAGYQHYEVSNYAAGRKWRSRHNTAYWSGAAYLGFGPSAHSYDGRSRRSWNRLGLNEYLEAVESGGLPRPISRTSARDSSCSSGSCSVCAPATAWTCQMQDSRARLMKRSGTCSRTGFLTVSAPWTVSG